MRNVSLIQLMRCNHQGLTSVRRPVQCNRLLVRMWDDGFEVCEGIFGTRTVAKNIRF